MPELDRRDFLKAVGVSAGAAVTAACQDPVEKVIPYLNQPEEILPGTPTFYASVCRECPASCAVQIRTREGRPIKLEGNPEDPVNGGALCVRGQAGLARTYDPARFRGPMRREGEALVPISWQDGMVLLVEKLRPAAAAGRVAFLGGSETGTLDAIIDGFVRGIGSPYRVRYEPYALEALRAADEIVFGTSAVPTFDFASADVVVSFGGDFLETWLNPVQNQAGFSESRREGKGYAVWVGPRLGLTGGNADEWLQPRPGTEIFVALGLAREFARHQTVRGALAPYTLSEVARLSGVSESALRKVADRLRAAKAPLAVPPGVELLGTNGTAFAAAVQILNHALGAVGRTVRFGPNHSVDGLARFGDMRDLAGRMRSGEVEVLLVHGANPAYDVPNAFGFDEALAKVPFVVSFSSAEDETTAHADLVLPDHTPFEAWGDAEPVRGVRRVQQPTIRPIFDTRAVGDVLLEAGRALGASGLPAGTFRDALAARWGGAAALDGALGRGGDFRPASAVPVGLAPRAGRLAFEAASFSGDGQLTLLAYPSLHFYDGRSARIRRLQEIPDPVTKATWGSYAELNPETAASLGVEEGDVVRVRTEAGELELPALPHDGVAPGVIAIAIGQGHQPIEPDLDLNERWGQTDWLGRTTVQGVNVLAALPGKIDAASGGLAFYSAKAAVEKTGRSEHVPKTQPDFSQEDRGFARATTLAALAGREEEPFHDTPHLEIKEFDPARDSGDDSPYRWGMVVDTDACTGCNACLAACAQENNIPTIGRELVARGREMHWIRIERYVEHHGETLEVRHLPMLCQHCGSAPCESVCPVAATSHTPEGLNGMIYNRCIGTRYCSNNCPYKVRRFNYLPYDFEVREPEHLGLNPDVTVRTKGVMEKCTFCIQRIHYARDHAKGEGRIVGDGELETACQQGCPSRAIRVGNLKDPASEVSKRSADPRAYHALDHLYTRPGITYLKSLWRGEKRDSGHGGDPGDANGHG